MTRPIPDGQARLERVDPAVLLAFTSFMHLLVHRHVTHPRVGLADVDPATRRALRAVRGDDPPVAA